MPKKQNKKKKPIKGIVKAIINGALSLVDALLVNRIPQSEIKALTLLATERVRATVKVLSDANEHDGEQVGRVWLDMLNDAAFMDNVSTLIQQQVNKIEQASLQSFLNSLLTPVLQTVQALTDEIKPDGQQVAAIWKSFFVDAESVAALFLLFDPKQKHTDEIKAGAAFFTATLLEILNSIENEQ